MHAMPICTSHYDGLLLLTLGRRPPAYIARHQEEALGTVRIVACVAFQQLAARHRQQAWV